MKSSPASSASLASSRQSSQLADQRSGTLVAERPDEQLAPNRPILSALSLYMAMRACIDPGRANTTSSSAQYCLAPLQHVSQAIAIAAELDPALPPARPIARGCRAVMLHANGRQGRAAPGE